jgi:hypothetical protein
VVSLRDLRSYPHRINPEEPQKPYGRLFFRPISLYLTWVCVNLGFSANQITSVQLVIGVLAAAAVACPTVKIGFLGLLLFQLGFMLDNIDGEIARFRKQASLTGKFLDEIGHQTVVPLMYLGFGVGDFLRHGRWEIIVFAALAGLSSLRIDLLSKAEVILNFAQSGSDSKFDYYKRFPAPQSPTTSAEKHGPIARLRYLFAYPATMNTLSILWLLDRFTGTGTIVHGNAGLLYLLIVVYGIVIPIRRTITICSVATRSRVETDYLELRQAVEAQALSKEVNTPTPRP